MIAIKVIAMMNVLRSVLLVACSVIFTTTHADTSKATNINFPAGVGWGEPIFNQYTSTNKTNEWRYARKNATLIITRTECEKCKPITQQDVVGVLPTATPGLVVISPRHETNMTHTNT